MRHQGHAHLGQGLGIDARHGLTFGCVLPSAEELTEDLIEGPEESGKCRGSSGPSHAVTVVSCQSPSVSVFPTTTLVIDLNPALST